MNIFLQYLDIVSILCIKSVGYQEMRAIWSTTYRQTDDRKTINIIILHTSTQLSAAQKVNENTYM